MAELNPTFPLQLAIARAYRIGMKMKPPRQFSRARQALPCYEVVTQNAQNDLSHKLFADANLPSMGKPELQGALS